MSDRITTIDPLAALLKEVRTCTFCQDLPLGPHPVVRADSRARILVIGQAPGTRVHNTGIPWNDPSGERLRQWMGIDRDTFYDASRIAIMPMGFCYPGKGKSGDLPPRPECAPRWHPRVLEHLPHIELVLLIGQYAQRQYLDKNTAGKYTSLTERVLHWRELGPYYFPLVHPSPRNQRWLKRNPWFEVEVVPALQSNISAILAEQ